MSTAALRRRAVACVLVAALSASSCGGSPDDHDAREAAGNADGAIDTTTEPTATTVGPGAFADVVRSRDLAAIQATLADDIELYSPVFAEPFTGQDRVGRLFGILLDTFEDVEITDEITGDDRFVLVFDARIGGEPIQIVDRISFDDTGRIETFVVTARPPRWNPGAGHRGRAPPPRARRSTLLTGLALAYDPGHVDIVGYHRQEIP